MEARHHYDYKRVTTQRAVNVARRPSSTVGQVANRHDRLDKLTFKPFFDVVDDFTNGWNCLKLQIRNSLCREHQVKLGGKSGIQKRFNNGRQTSVAR